MFELSRISELLTSGPEAWIFLVLAVTGILIAVVGTVLLQAARRAHVQHVVKVLQRKALITIALAIAILMLGGPAILLAVLFIGEIVGIIEPSSEGLDGLIAGLIITFGIIGLMMGIGAIYIAAFLAEKVAPNMNRIGSSFIALVCIGIVLVLSALIAPWLYTILLIALLTGFSAALVSLFVRT